MRVISIIIQMDNEYYITSNSYAQIPMRKLRQFVSPKQNYKKKLSCFIAQKVNIGFLTLAKHCC